MTATAGTNILVQALEELSRRQDQARQLIDGPAGRAPGSALGVAPAVRSAESWEGDPVTAQAGPLQAALDESLRNWLKNLKHTAEAHP